MILRTKIIVGTISILILAGTSLGVYFGVFYEFEEEPDPIPESVLLTIHGISSKTNYTMTQLKNMTSITGTGGYRRSTGTIEGLATYTGVLLSDLLDEVGGLSSGNEVDVIAEDDYSITFTEEMINGNFPAYDKETGEYLGLRNFRVIVAYEKDGTKLPPGDGKLRIACLADEGEDYLSDSSPWVKEVDTIRIFDSISWSINLYGSINDSIDKENFEAFMYMNDKANLLVYQLLESERTNTYEGLALWRIIGLIDDTDPYSFNETLASGGYLIILWNENDENVTLNSVDISLNDSYILAAKKNSIFLSDDQAPLMLVGPVLHTLQMIDEIDEIELVF